MYTGTVTSTKKEGTGAAIAVRPISATSPLARGFTVSILPEAHPAGGWWLRVWSDGKPVENSRWASPSKAAMRVGAIVLDGTLGANLRGQAVAAAAQFMGGSGQ